MNIFKNIVHLIEDNTDIPEQDEAIIEWAKDNTENEMIFNIYTFAAFASTINNFEIPLKKAERQKLKNSINIVFRNTGIPLSFLGTRYLEAILMDGYNVQINRKIRDIYREYATRFKVEPNRVERAIRYIVDSYQRKLQNYFNTSAKITPKKLLFLLQVEVDKNMKSCVWNTVFDGFL